MAEQLILKNLEFIKILPAWAQELSYKYCSQTANLYIVHGNIRDFLPNKMYEGEFVFVRIQEFISEVLFGNKDIIAFYDRSSGINFCTPEMQKEYVKAMHAAFPDEPLDNFIDADPNRAFQLLERYFLTHLSEKLRIVLIVDFAETIVPNTPLTQLNDKDRYSLTTLYRWAHDPMFTQGDISIILLSENISDIHDKLVRSPHTVKVNIPFPDGSVRKSFLDFLQNQEETLLLGRHMTTEYVSRVTSGLNLMNLHQIASESFQEDAPLDQAYLRDKKKAIIENEAAGLLEFIETDRNLNHVAGHSFVKSRFRNAAKAIKKGRLDVLPMGYLLSGPVGTGKTYMVTSFAGEVGIPIVKFRSQWHGATEANFDKVMTILKAMAPVGVLIDEADILLGSRRRTDQKESQNWLFTRISDFMGNTEYRGRIIWFMVTSRPDLLPIDLKRQGRAEEHLALFPPDTQEDKEELFKILVKKLEAKVQDFPALEVFKRNKLEFSGADLEAILIRAKFRAAMDNRIIITREDWEATVKDFIPPIYPYELELQNLVAVLECTSRDMVPKKFRNMERGRIISEIQQLKTLMGENS